MKKTAVVLMLLPIVAVLFAFAAPKSEANCYDKYAKKFEERGAKEVEDGWHDDIVVTFRKGSNADCARGKVEVKSGKITQIKLLMADGSYERYTKKFKAGGEFTVTNGISTTQITTDDELVNVIFIKHIKPPKKKFVAAPDPDDL